MARKRDEKLPPQPDLNALRREFEEFQTPFEHGQAARDIEPASIPDLATFRLVHQAVVRNYGNVCAMTGAPDLTISDTGSGHRVTVIRPRGAGGSLHAANFILLCHAAAEAFTHGRIAIGPSHQLLVDLSSIDPELLEELNPNGRLRLPKSGAPDDAALAWHRQQAFARG